MENVERMFKGKITKVIPSITSEVFEGVSLVCHNSAVNDDEADYINNLFSSIGNVKIIDEADFDVGTDITSSAPAFMARIFMEFARTAFNKQWVLKGRNRRNGNKNIVWNFKTPL